SVDWLGLTLTVSVAILMAGAYAYAFNPANKERFNDHRFIPLCDDRLDKED
ncbi:MAG: cbb3-type cytochrome c oxidase subunit 3, partial [Nitrospinae bacterium]|nr:cbb3-type cytochrome c oxidase subunit 3 [Nitrospinota bacterium]